MSDGPVLTIQIAERLKDEDVTSDLSSFKAVEAAALAVLTSHCFELNLEGLATLSDEVATVLGTFSGTVLLPAVHSISDTSAELLSTHCGDLDLSGIRHITHATAVSLSKHSGSLCLDGIATLTDKVASAFATFEHDLSLCGIEQLSDSAAKSLSTQQGYLWLDGLQSIANVAFRMLRSRAAPLSLEALEQSTFTSNDSSYAPAIECIPDKDKWITASGAVSTVLRVRRSFLWMQDALQTDPSGSFVLGSQKFLAIENGMKSDDVVAIVGVEPVVHNRYMRQWVTMSGVTLRVTLNADDTVIRKEMHSDWGQCGTDGSKKYYDVSTRAVLRWWFAYADTKYVHWFKAALDSQSHFELRTTEEGKETIDVVWADEHAASTPFYWEPCVFVRNDMSTQTVDALWEHFVETADSHELRKQLRLYEARDQCINFATPEQVRKLHSVLCDGDAAHAEAFKEHILAEYRKRESARRDQKKQETLLEVIKQMDGGALKTKLRTSCTPQLSSDDFDRAISALIDDGVVVKEQHSPRRVAYRALER